MTQMPTPEDPDAHPHSPAIVATWERLKTPNVPSWQQLQGQLEDFPKVPLVELWLVRHGETTTNAQGLVTGTVDASLTSKGLEQAHRAGSLLNGQSFAIAWSSTLQRGRETLEGILRGDGVRAGSIQEDKRLDERSLGELELKPARPIAEFARGDLSYAPRGGESYESVARRCLMFLVDLANLSMSAERDLKLLACTHVGPMRIIAGILNRIEDPAKVLDLQFDNSVPTRFEFDQLEFPEFVRRSWKSRSRAAA